MLRNGKVINFINNEKDKTTNHLHQIIEAVLHQAFEVKEMEEV